MQIFVQSVSFIEKSGYKKDCRQEIFAKDNSTFASQNGTHFTSQSKLITLLDLKSIWGPKIEGFRQDHVRRLQEKLNILMCVADEWGSDDFTPNEHDYLAPEVKDGFLENC